MLFNSLDFLLFFVFFFSIYLLLRHKWQNILLIVASCLFYAFWNWKFLFLMFFSISTDFICAKHMARCDRPRTRKALLFTSVGVNLAILGFFKYSNFFATNLIDALKVLGMASPSAHWAIRVILPLGISFYTFEAISYVVDVYRRTVKPAAHYWDYVLFVIFFPHLIAGPIMRAKSFLPQVATPRRISWEGFYEGCYYFFWGLFEKMFVADNLARIVDPVFNGAQPARGADILLALYAFSFQIFCDFDGYSNMARGLGKMMGFDLAINFQWPYFSKNPREFWQRWHITLSSWLRDYIYIPLGGNRGSGLRININLMLTMLLGGLWHGANWTFVLWGFYHGCLIVAYRVFGQSGQDQTRKSVQWIQAIVFFHCVAFGWLLFRAHDLAQAQGFVREMAFHMKAGPETFLTLQKFLLTAMPLLVVQMMQYRRNDLLWAHRLPWILKPLFFAALAYCILGWGVLRPETFIYFQF